MANKRRPLAVTVMPLETRHDAILNLATRAEELDYDAFSLTETWSHDSTLVLTNVAVKTQRIRLWTGILGLWGRSAATIAMAAATLNDISGGRFTLGLGSSTKLLAEGLHDTPFHAPLRKLRQTIKQVRSLLDGKRIPLSVSEEARALRLNAEPHPDVSIFLAASSPESIRIAGELSDGWIPFFYPRDRLADGIALLREGAERGEEPFQRLQVCPSIPTVVAEDPETARIGAAWFVSFYIMMMGPIYRNTLARLGFEAEVNAVVEANTDRKPSLVPGKAESLLKQLTIYGTPEQARNQLNQWYEAGSHMPMLALSPNLTRKQTDYVLNAFRP